MKMGAFMMGCGLLVCGLDLMPFWFMGTCVAAGLALIAQETQEPQEKEFDVEEILKEARSEQE